MKYIKILLFALCLFIINGCTAVYNVNLTVDDINEELTVTGKGITDEYKKTYTTYPLSVNMNNGCFIDYDTLEGVSTTKETDVNYYNVKEIEKGLSFNARMKKYSYQDARIANSFFNKMHFNNYEHLVSFYGYDGIMAFKEYPDLEEVTINITVDKAVTDHDADEVNGNTYTWKFDRNTGDDKTLYLEMDKTKKAISGSNTGGLGEFIKNNIVLVIFIIIIIALLVILGYRIYRNKK